MCSVTGLALGFYPCLVGSLTRRHLAATAHNGSQMYAYALVINAIHSLKSIPKFAVIFCAVFSEHKNNQFISEYVYIYISECVCMSACA